RDHKEGDVVAGAILTEMVKLASQDKTTVLAIACGQNTIKTLSGFSGIMKLIDIARLEIDRLVKEFLTAMNAAGRSL
ncbi:MAG: hypothetical protein WCT15_01850, partial [Candidatus Omnitrophota bacterium]